MNIADGQATPAIDWAELARELDALTNVDTRKGQLALAAIIGEARIRDAVDWYVVGREGAELARFALWRLQPPAARDRCVEIWRSDAVPLHRQLAVELLCVVATARDLPLVAEFLADRDPGVQTWGFGVLDQLLWSRQVERDDAVALLAVAARHENPSVRDQHTFVIEYLDARDEERR